MALVSVGVMGTARPEPISLPGSWAPPGSCLVPPRGIAQAVGPVMKSHMSGG